MVWQLAISVATAANVTTTLIRRRYAQKSSSPVTFPPAAAYLLGVMPVGLFAGLFVFPHFIHWSWWLAILLLIEGSAMAVAGATGFKAAGKLKVAPLQTIGQLTTVAAIILGWTVLGEGLTTHQLMGGAILFIAALIAIWAPQRNALQILQKTPKQFIMLAVVASLASAVGLVTEKAVLGHVDIGGAFLVGWSAQCLAMILLASKDATIDRLRIFAKQELKWAVVMGTANGLTGVFYVYALVHSNNISLISAIASIALPLTVLGAYLFFKERQHHLLMWVSLIVSFIGLLVLSLR